MKQTVLIVDDNKDLCELFSVAFSSTGFKVLTANRGDEALELIAENKIDVMTLDNDMPGMSGLDMLQILSQTNYLETMKVIMVSANGAIALDPTVQALANLVLHKPVSFIQLIQLSTRLMKQAGTR